MSGHAILDSCHHCGTTNVELFVTSVSPTSSSCQFAFDEDEPGQRPRHHIHVTVACGDCKRIIWEKEDDA